MSHQSPLIASDIDAYLAQHERKEILRFITCGSVDDGKSTLIGRLFYESKTMYEDQLAALRQDTSRYGTSGNSSSLTLPATSNTPATWQRVLRRPIWQLF